MTNYNVRVVDDFGVHRFDLSLKVKHFRQYTGRQVNPNGGHTCIFDRDSGLVFSSKCRDDEQFSKRKGVLTCLQKMLQCPAFQCQTPKNGYWINDAEFGDNRCTITIWHPSSDYVPYWFLSDSRLGSGLYREAKNGN